MLTQRQQKTVAFAITLFCAIAILWFILVCFLLCGWVIQRFSSILLPLAVAGVLAMVLKPYLLWWERRLGGRPVVAIFTVLLSVLIPLAVAMVAFGLKVVTEVPAAIGAMELWAMNKQIELEQTWPSLQAFWQEYQLSEKLKAGVRGHGTAILNGLTRMTDMALAASGNVFRSLAGLFSWVILPVYLAFFLLGKPVEKKKFEDLFPFLREETRKDLSYLAFEFIAILVSFFRGQILISFFQAMLFAIGFSIVRLEYGFTLGLALGFLNIIPYLGSMVGLSIALPVAFFQDGGGGLLFILVLVVFGIVQAIEGYVLTPKIMGDRTGLHPLAIIVAIFFWGSVFGGITGMILAIPLTAFLVVFWRLAKSKYIQEVL